MDNRLYENLTHKNKNYIFPFFWMHGENKEAIIDEIHRIYDCGIRGLCLESRIHEDFCGEGWWHDVGVILEECSALDMKVWILDDKHFPTGHANGAFIYKNRDLRAMGITQYHIDVAGPVNDGSAMVSCWKKLPDDEIMGIYACRRNPDKGHILSGEVLDITAGMAGDMVYFDLPEGVWRIVFLIKTRSGISEYFSKYGDRLNPQATDVFINAVYEPHYEHFAGYFGNTFCGFFSDEPGFYNNTSAAYITDIGEMFAHYPWSDCIKKRFSSESYSDLLGLWFEFEDDSEQKIRIKYMNIISEAYKENFTGRLAKWCHKHGILYTGHVVEDNNAHAMTGAGPGHFFRAEAYQDIAGVDVVQHQIVPGMSEYSTPGEVCYKHMNNKFFNCCLAKLASSAAHIDSLKKGRALCEIFGAYGWAEGTKLMKYLTDHMLVRGINMFVPHAFSPKDNDLDCPPNFYARGHNPQYRYFKYLMQYMNRMCYLFNDGEHVIKLAVLYDAEVRWSQREFISTEDVAKVLYDRHLDYDIIPVDALDIAGIKYKMIVVPSKKGLPEYAREKLRNLNVVYADEFTSLDKVPEFIISKGLADIETDEKCQLLRHLHYFRDGAHYYLFTNEDIHNCIKTKVKLSVFNGGEYVIYDAMENKALKKVSLDGSVEIFLEPYESVVIAFGEVNVTAAEAEKEMIMTYSEPIENFYRISLAEAKENPEFVFYKYTNELFNITGRKGIMDFSGHIKYETKLFIKEKGMYKIDLGQVGEIAELSVNNKKAGVKIIPPYCFDISDMINEGENDITITVTNHYGYSQRDMFSKYLLFEPSGLLGPVSLKKYK